LGATNACHEYTSMPGTPASVNVGTVGTLGSRLSAVTASSFILPAFTCCVIEPRFWNEQSTLPAMRSRCAALPPL
jgi:hypothetical protein